ncbi:hypothetical protein L3X38_009111 [Prunus dulcis]|uniref:Uncharacterized protein n=1 Tax=Prunus dulcis TaxID=3755 RepID=A0AAD4ZXX9_PRUDU|nr:hypothetical protein L3X38_009111 [Prunus dulcis]
MERDSWSFDSNDIDLSRFDLSKNDSYLISATGGVISIFDMTTFKLLLAHGKFHHYNLHSDEVTRKLEGHSKRVTSLAFSNTLNIFVWEKQRSKLLQTPDGKELRSLSDTYIQIHQNELHLLAINKTHLAVYEVKALACV